MNVVEILKAAKAKIADPANWTQGEFARDSEGKKLDTGFSDQAVCFCSLGALEAVTKMDFYYATSAYRFLDSVMGGATANYNDNHTHDEVMGKWDEAIRLAENEA